MVAPVSDWPDCGLQGLLSHLCLSERWINDWNYDHLLLKFPKILIPTIQDGLVSTCGFAQILGRLSYNYLLHCWELMKLMDSHGSLSLLFMMIVMVWCFVSGSHKVMTVLAVVLLWSYGDLSAMLDIFVSTCLDDCTPKWWNGMSCGWMLWCEL
jgi:hypothetical protein